MGHHFLLNLGNPAINCMTGKDKNSSFSLISSLSIQKRASLIELVFISGDVLISNAPRIGLRPAGPVTGRLIITQLLQHDSNFSFETIL